VKEAAARYHTRQNPALLYLTCAWGKLWQQNVLTVALAPAERFSPVRGRRGAGAHSFVVEPNPAVLFDVCARVMCCLHRSSTHPNSRHQTQFIRKLARDRGLGARAGRTRLVEVRAEQGPFEHRNTESAKAFVSSHGRMPRWSQTADAARKYRFTFGSCTAVPGTGSKPKTGCKV
jgi:hypothetical protein